jgi:hypothetical protein
MSGRLSGSFPYVAPYAGGDFTNAGGVLVKHVAKWDGTSWSALGSGMAGSLPYVNALRVDRVGNVYAGGFFTTAGGMTVNGVAKWNGSSWSALGSGISGANANVEDFAFDSSGNVYAGGSFNAAGATPAS